MSEQIILPKRYKRLSYLADTGLQWIDTEYIPTNNTGLWIDAQQNVHTNGHVMGSGVDTNSPADGFTAPRWLKSTGNTAGYAWGVWKSWGRISDGSRFVSSLNFNNDKKALLTTIDETSQSFTGDLTDLTFTPTKSIFLFTTNKDGNPHTYPWQGKIFEAKISEGTTVVRHFIPAYDTYNSRGCMYEVIEGKAYYTKGTSDFLYELDLDLDLEDTQLGILHKLPEGFTKVNYLIANGFQYIDTNYIPTNETGYYVEGQAYNATNSYILGARNESSSDTRIYFALTQNIGYGWNVWGDVTKDAAYLRQETKVSLNFLNNRTVLTSINEKDFTSVLSDLIFIPSQSIFLFTFNNGGTPYAEGLKGRIDTFLISEGDQIVRQFVPCLDEDGIPCMYELYTGTVHYNQGSGQFSYPRDYINDPINLPAGYTKCVYLQSNGTQWIDTEVIPTDETGLYLKAQHLGYDFHVPLGSVITNQIMFYPPIYSLSNKYSAYAFKSALVQMFYYNKADDLIYTSTMNLYNDRTVNLWSEDTEHHGIVTPTPNTTEMPSLWLFSWNAGTGAIHATNGKFIGRIFRAKITQGVYLIHDFVPCLDTDNRPCMYDLVTQQPYYNQSGGVEFAYCVEHQLPSDFIKLKYLESTGTQIIKTGYIPTNNTGLYIDAYHTKYNGNTNGCTIGLRNTNGNTYFFAPRVQRDTNGAGFGWGAFTTPGGNGNCRYEGSLNFLNDRKAIITAPAFAQRINALDTLSFTPTKDLYMFGMNNYNGAATSYSTYRIYRAKISEGSEIVRDFVPAYDQRTTKPCMYDLINNVAYYNDGTGEFIYNRDFEGTYTGFTGLGCIGNKLGSDYNPVSQVALPYGYTKADFLESTGTQYINTLLRAENLSLNVKFKAFKNGSGEGLGVCGCQFSETIDGTTYFNKEHVSVQSNSNSKTGYHCGIKYGNTYGYATFYNSELNLLCEADINMKDLQSKLIVETFGTKIQQIPNNTRGLNFGLMKLFSGPQGGHVGHIYSFSANYDGIPAANYVPAIDPSGVPCMYDTVTERPFYNNGTGQFIVGLKTLSQAISLRLPETGGTLQLSLPTNDNVEYYEEKIRANNPSWNFTFSYH